jgi:transporter family protein
MGTRKYMPRWLAWTLITVVTWGVWSFVARLLAADIESPAQAQAVSTIGIVPVLIVLFAIKDAPGAGNRLIGVSLALGSGIISCLGNIAYFDVFNRGGKAAAVIPVTALYPVVTVLLAVPLLKERVSQLQWLGIALSLAAIYFLNVPADDSVVSSWIVFALGPIVLWGVCGLMQKMATNHISARLSAVWFLLAFLPVAVMTLVYDPIQGGLPAKTLTLAAAFGFSLALGNLTVLLAFESGGKASIIAPMCGLYPLIGIPLAIVLLGERISPREVGGVLCALAAIALLSFPTEGDALSTASTDMESIG